jgi:hypothetical protein
MIDYLEKIYSKLDIYNENRNNFWDYIKLLDINKIPEDDYYFIIISCITRNIDDILTIIANGYQITTNTILIVYAIANRTGCNIDYCRDAFANYLSSNKDIIAVDPNRTVHITDCNNIILLERTFGGLFIGGKSNIMLGDHDDLWCSNNYKIADKIWETGYAIVYHLDKIKVILCPGITCDDMYNIVWNGHKSGVSKYVWENSIKTFQKYYNMNTRFGNYLVPDQQWVDNKYEEYFKSDDENNTQIPYIMDKYFQVDIAVYINNLQELPCDHKIIYGNCLIYGKNLGKIYTTGTKYSNYYYFKKGISRLLLKTLENICFDPDYYILAPNHRDPMFVYDENIIFPDEVSDDTLLFIVDKIAVYKGALTEYNANIIKTVAEIAKQISDDFGLNKEPPYIKLPKSATSNYFREHDS